MRTVHEEKVVIAGRARSTIHCLLMWDWHELKWLGVIQRGLGRQLEITEADGIQLALRVTGRADEEANA